jgi:hypothetical protein
LSATLVETLRQTQIDAQIRRIESRLVREGSMVPPAVVHEWVESAWSRYSRARVQAFVPLLVERTVRSWLAATPAARLRDWARATAERMLAAELPGRWAHTQGVVGRAEEIAWLFPEQDRDVLVAAAWLHDIGYSSQLLETGFHPLDGARFLTRQGVPARVCALVAHHSGAVAVAGLVGLSEELAAFEDDRSPLRDALWYSDMTIGPDGRPLSFTERLAELRGRREPGDPVVLALNYNGDERAAAVRRTEALLESRARLPIAGH